MKISSLPRKDRHEVRNLLVTLCGADNISATIDVLKTLNYFGLEKNTIITVVRETWHYVIKKCLLV